MILRFAVYGEPKPQGSKRAMPIRRGGKPVMTRIIDDNPKTKVWRQEVAQMAAAALAEARASASDPWPSGLIAGPVAVEMTFQRPRPQDHYGTGKNRGRLKPGAGKYPIKRPDTVKLARAVEDALTGVVWRDDSQVVRHVLEKTWGECFVLVVSVSTLD